jgi:hypothetical protein
VRQVGNADYHTYDGVRRIEINDRQKKRSKYYFGNDSFTAVK